MATVIWMRHYGIHNDTYVHSNTFNQVPDSNWGVSIFSAFTEPSLPLVDYPEGFQENWIPVHGPFVAKLIEERIDGVAI